MSMYEYSRQKSGGAPVKPIPGGSTATGSAEDEAKKESEQSEEPEKGFGQDGSLKELHEHLADHHESRAAHHERMSNEHERQAEHHRKEAAYHDGKAAEYE